ncbi:MAG: carboxypeptidase-like regulatory domain-containing protein [Isosphaeraceae bacterium]|nr:carboxypeptidase-like regulatory domain-containing protein [Isosphaeraceae bacterium]
MIPPRDHVPGDSVGSSGLGGPTRINAETAAMLNGLRDGIRQLQNLSVVQPMGLSVDDRGGRSLSLDTPAVVWGKLTGSGTTFVDCVWDPGSGAWVNAPSGFTDYCYAVGSGANIGQVVRLTKVGTNDWRYTYPKMCGSVCAILKDSDGSPVAGATVTLTPDSGPPITGTTDPGGNWCVANLATGYYYIDLSGLPGGMATPPRITLYVSAGCCCQYTLAWSGGSATPTPSACCKCVTSISVTTHGLCSPGISHLSGVAVTLTDPDGVTIGTLTTDSTGEVSWPDVGHKSGTYTLVSVWNGAQTQTVTVNVTQCQGYTVGFTFVDKTTTQVLGCNGPISGATVTCGPVSGTTDGSGNCTLDWSHNVPPTPFVETITIPTGPTRTVTVGNNILFPGNPCSTQETFQNQVCVSTSGCFEVTGFEVEISCGTESFSGTTSSSGELCFVPTTDWGNQTATVTVSKPPYYQTVTHTYDLTLAVTGQFANGAICELHIDLPPIDCYICCNGCHGPVPSSINITDLNGNHTASIHVLSGPPGLCQASTIYHAPISTNACGAPVVPIQVTYTLDLGPTTGIWTLIANWGARECISDPTSFYAYPIPGDSPPLVTDVATVVLGAICGPPVSGSGTMPASGSVGSPNPVAGPVSISDACTTYSSGCVLPSAITVNFDGSALLGSLAGTSLSVAYDSGLGDYPTSCLTTTTDGGRCDPTAPTEGLLTITLSLTGTGTVNATAQWTGGTHLSTCADGSCSYYGTATGSGLPMNNAPQTLSFSSMTYSSGGSGSFAPSSSPTALAFTTPGDTTWTCPAGVTSVQVECWGGGGAGSSLAGGGAGGGAYARGNAVPVTPGTVYAVHVGSGGSGAGTGGQAGDGSYFNTVGTVFATPGQGTSSNTGAAGGTAALSVGDVTFDGGNGGNASTNDTGQQYGGGGGGVAGSGGAGANGGNATSTAGGIGGGAGTSGGNGEFGTGLNGSSAGGGGGGGGTGASGASSGGNGQVLLTWSVGGPMTISIEVPCGS